MENVIFLQYWSHDSVMNGRIDTQLFCVFAFVSEACLLSEVMEFKLRLVFHELGFVAHDLGQSQNTHCT